MENVFFILSSVFFIAEFGINYKIANTQDKMDFNYNPSQLFNIGAWLSGFVLSAISLSFALDIKWYFIIIINTLVCWFLHPVFAFLYRSLTGYGNLHRDKKIVMIIAIVLFVIGLVL
ncbi:hypothetical protein [Winogradskyella sp. PC D3.3]